MRISLYHNFKFKHTVYYQHLPVCDLEEDLHDGVWRHLGLLAGALVDAVEPLEDVVVHRVLIGLRLKNGEQSRCLTSLTVQSA